MKTTKRRCCAAPLPRALACAFAALAAAGAHAGKPHAAAPAPAASAAAAATTTTSAPDPLALLQQRLASRFGAQGATERGAAGPVLRVVSRSAAAGAVVTRADRCVRPAVSDGCPPMRSASGRLIKESD